MERDVVNADVAMDLYTAVHGTDSKGGAPRAPAAAAKAVEYSNQCYVVMSVLGELSALSFAPFVEFLPDLLAFAILHLPNPLNASTYRQECNDDREGSAKDANRASTCDAAAKVARGTGSRAGARLF